MLRARTTLLTLLGALAAAALASSGPATPGASPKLNCKIAKALTRVPAKPVWFPIPQPAQTTLIVNADAPPKYANGLKWATEARYYWLVRLPRGRTLDDPKAKLVLTAHFDNLNRTVNIHRLADQRLLAQWRTSARGPDTTTAIAKNITGTEFGQFLSTLRNVQYPTNC